jgi:hypothetical protein
LNSFWDGYLFSLVIGNGLLLNPNVACEVKA